MQFGNDHHGNNKIYIFVAFFSWVHPSENISVDAHVHTPRKLRDKTSSQRHASVGLGQKYWYMPGSTKLLHAVTALFGLKVYPRKAVRVPFRTWMCAHDTVLS